MKKVIIVGTCFLLILAGGGAYFGFRTTRFDRDIGHTMFYHRSWGRITSITVDSNLDGKIDQEYTYSWQRPFVGLHGNEPRYMRYDFNTDGAWDTWHDVEESTLDIDTDGDGISDLTLDATSTGKAYAQARDIRGY